MRGLAVFFATVVGMLLIAVGVMYCLMGVIGWISAEILPWSFEYYFEGLGLVLIGFALMYLVRQLVKEDLA
jgi:hypothetical protein